MTSQRVRDELLLSDIAEFFAEEVTELSKLPPQEKLRATLSNPDESPLDLSNWELQVFEFEFE